MKGAKAEQHHDLAPEALFFGGSFNPGAQAVRYFERVNLDAELGDPDVFSWIYIQAAEISALNGAWSEAAPATARPPG